MNLPTAISDWLQAFARAVRTRDYDSARALFVPDVISFGTAVERATCLADLERFQWSVVWPVTEDFAFVADTLSCQLSPDGQMAVVTGQWSSYGRSSVPGRERYLRTGRATIVLSRMARLDFPWLARHTHFSLSPRRVEP